MGLCELYYLFADAKRNNNDATLPPHSPQGIIFPLRVEEMKA